MPQLDAEKNLSAERREVRRIADLLNTLPPTFGQTMSAHMKRLRVTNEMLAERLDASARWVSNLRGRTIPKLKMPALVAICLCLHLEPELSEDLISKAGLCFLPVEEHLLYRRLLRSRYAEPLENCNEMLRRAGFDALRTGSKRDAD